MIKIREMSKEDLPFIYSSWIRSYAGQNKDQPKWAVYRLQMEAIKSVIPLCRIYVATPETGDDDDICGWVCHFDRVYQFIYVKSPFRRFGVAKILMASTGWNGEAIVAAYKPPWQMKNKIQYWYAPQLQHGENLRRFEDENFSRETQH